MENVYDTPIGHRLTQATAWLPSRPAEQMNDHLWMSRNNSYPYLVTSDVGGVAINRGTSYQGL